MPSYYIMVTRINKGSLVIVVPQQVISSCEQTLNIQSIWIDSYDRSILTTEACNVTEGLGFGESYPRTFFHFVELITASYQEAWAAGCHSDHGADDVLDGVLPGIRGADYLLARWCQELLGRYPDRKWDWGRYYLGRPVSKGSWSRTSSASAWSSSPQGPPAPPGQTRR